jgi:hypothetical protein
MIRSTLLLATALCGFVAAAAHAETIKFHDTMNGASEVPPKTTDGTGSVDATLDTATKVLTYTMTYSGLSGPATAAHFHGPAAPGTNAGVLVPMSPPLNSPVKGTATLTDAQMADFMDGKVYTNVHTAANPGGEIRGQLAKQ